MSYIKGYRCTVCGKFYRTDDHMLTCPSCGEKGILDVVYYYDELKEIFTIENLRKNPERSIWRYYQLMGVKEEHISKMLKIGWSPLYKANNLSEYLGIKQLYIKDDGQNPSGSSKDRASGVAVLKALESGAKVIACASTGNAASSLACHSARMGLKSVIFVPARAPIGKVSQILLYGATLVPVDGDYRTTYQLSKEAIEKYGWYNRNAAINPFNIEGKKTVAYEIIEQLDFNVPDWVIMSVGDGCSIGGLYKGFYEFYLLGLISRVPKILGVQSTGCQPFVTASKTNSDLKECEELTIADSIAVGKPRNPLKALKAVKESGGSWISVSDEDIISSMALLGSKEGIFGEPAGVCPLAGLIQAMKENIIKKDETVTIVITGNGLKDPSNAQKAVSRPSIIEPTIDVLDSYLKEKGAI